jgi:hypothetical protein
MHGAELNVRIICPLNTTEEVIQTSDWHRAKPAVARLLLSCGVGIDGWIPVDPCYGSLATAKQVHMSFPLAV